MSGKLSQISTSFRPITRIALENKIRAMISQFHPREKQFVLLAHENTLNSIGNYYLQTELPFVTLTVKNTTKTDQFSLVNKQSNEYIYTYKKVIQWLEDLDCDLQRRKT